MNSTVRSHGNIPKCLLEAENTAIFAPPEVPKCAIEKMFGIVTSRFQEQISEEDLLKFSQKNLLGFSAEKISEMFNEALLTGFNYTHGQRMTLNSTVKRKIPGVPMSSPVKANSQKKKLPKRFLTVKDVQAALRTRKDPENKGLYLQRPFRENWIAIIQAANPEKRIFNFPQVHAVAPPLTLSEQWDQYEEEMKMKNEPLFQPQLFEPRFDHMENVFANDGASISAFSKSLNKLSSARPKTGHSTKSKSAFNPGSTGFNPLNISCTTLPDGLVDSPVEGSEIFTVQEDGLEVRRNTTTGQRPYTGQSTMSKASSWDPIKSYNRLYSPMGRPSTGQTQPGSPLSRPWTGNSMRSSKSSAWKLTRTASLSPRTDLSRTMAPSYVSKGTRSAGSKTYSTMSRQRPYNASVDGLLPQSGDDSGVSSIANEINRLTLNTGSLKKTDETNVEKIDSPRPEESPRMGFREKNKHTELLETLQSNSVDRRKSRQAAFEAALRRQERDAAMNRGRAKFRHQIGERTLQPQRFQDRQGWAQESLREAKRGQLPKTDRDDITWTGHFDYGLLKKTSEPMDIKRKVAQDQLSMFGRSPQAYYNKHDPKPYQHTFRNSNQKGKKDFQHLPVPVNKALPHEKLATIVSTDGTDYVRMMKESGWKLDKVER